MQGQPWKNLTGYDKNGNPQYQDIPNIKVEEGQPPVIDAKNQVQVQRWLQQLTGIKQNHQGQLEVLKQQHQQAYNISKQGISQIEQKFFKSFGDESKLPTAVKADIQMATDALISAAPAFKDNPLTKLLVKSYAALKLQQRQLFKMMQEMNKAKTNQNDAVKAGPAKLDFQGGSSSNGDKVLSADMFND